MALVERTRYELLVATPAAAVAAALTDFSHRRPLVWPETSHPKVYRLHDVGPTWADVTEGVPFTWSRELYDWSAPGIIRLSQIDSNAAVPGGRIEYRLTDTSEGCRIACERDRNFLPTLRGRVAYLVMTTIGPRILASQLRAGLGRHTRMVAAEG